MDAVCRSAAGSPVSAALSFEKSISELEDSIALYERGQALKSHCEAKLKAAEGRLDKLILGANGPTASETMDAA